MPLDDTLRYDVLLAALLFSILATGVALLVRRRGIALLSLAALVVITMIALYVWRSRQLPQAPAPAVPTVSPVTDRTVRPTSGPPATANCFDPTPPHLLS